jgi:hypothetical protein
MQVIIFLLEKKGIWKPLIWMIYACLIDRNGPAGSDVLIGVLADCFITINVWNRKGFQRHLNWPTPIKLMSKKWYTKLSSLTVSTVSLFCHSDATNIFQRSRYQTFMTIWHLFLLRCAIWFQQHFPMPEETLLRTSHEVFLPIIRLRWATS